MAMLVVLVVIVVLSLAAPLYAAHVAHTNPFTSNLDGTTLVDGKTVPVMQPETGGLGLGVTPIGPTWDPRHYLLGADNQGRDVAARLLYGGRNSLLIGLAAALLSCTIGTLSACVAGFFGGVTDGVLSRLLDVVWAFPVYLLAICLSIVLITGGSRPRAADDRVGQPLAADLHHRHRLPAVRRATDPRRGAVAPPERVRRGSDRTRGLELAPAPERDPAQRDHDRDRLLPDHDGDRHADRGRALVPLDRRAAAGRELGHDHPRRAGLLYTRPAVAIAPGVAIVITVLALNVLGDGVRDALDPRAKLRGVA